MRTIFSAHTFLVLTAVGFLGACSPSSEKGAEQTLEQLRAERAELDQRIAALEAAQGSQANASTAVPVTAITTQEAPFHHVVSVQGTVDSRSTISVAPQMGGRIVALNVANGSVVKKGDVLMELDAEMLRSTIAEVETQLDFATTLFVKQERIYQQKAGSEVQYLQAKANKESLERRRDVLREQLALMRVTAPTSGVVDNVTVSAGEMAMPGMPVLTIVNTSDMRVVIDLAEAYLHSINRGDVVRIMVPDLMYEFRSTIDHVARTLNTVNRTFRVEVPLRNVPARLLPNTTALVEITDQTIPQAISVPLTAVLQNNGESYVYVIGQDLRVEKRTISMGLVAGDLVQITQGLSANERVVVRGNQDVSPGSTVRIVDPS